MRGKVFISGGGSAEESLFLDRLFADSLKIKKVLYLPFGLERDLVDYDSCYDWLSRTLQQSSGQKIEIDMWVNMKNIAWDDVVSCGGIYIGGGKDAGRMLARLREVGLDLVLNRFLAQGGSIYGGSSGAILLGSRVDTFVSKDMQLGDLNGLGYIGSMVVFCHYGLHCHDEEIEKYVQYFDLPAVAIPESSGLVVTGGRAQIVGREAVKVFSPDKHKEEFLPNQCFEVYD